MEIFDFLQNPLHFEAARLCNGGKPWFVQSQSGYVTFTMPESSGLVERYVQRTTSLNHPYIECTHEAHGRFPIVRVELMEHVAEDAPNRFAVYPKNIQSGSTFEDVKRSYQNLGSASKNFLFAFSLGGIGPYDWVVSVSNKFYDDEESTDFITWIASNIRNPPLHEYDQVIAWLIRNYERFQKNLASIKTVVQPRE